ncbi:hypothetical protein K353_06679 [Kitasatospora sp. SolWspMP-SS2h]|uniref:hypothetical protein n=1 Tax=Kitasatospora sp. SolWspMP-SS2h TaxID=1305729 RepID=UPI000DB9CF0C|nr:hypothetical protein [Kitasatospora sp. SolWspMP-SS2h]RAJ29171.1 hypothetical protein K353_06679 [Kitasatospora sp. SolWspMP-SS2h]
MSLHFEVVFTCFLRGDTPETVLAALRWHLGLTPEHPAELDAEEHAYPLLAPDPDGRLPGGDFASLRRQSRGFAAGSELHAWGLFSRNYWLDDEMGDLVTILDLVAPHVEEPGYGGYFREEYDAEPTIFIFQNGTYGPLKL